MARFIGQIALSAVALLYGNDFIQHVFCARFGFAEFLNSWRKTTWAERYSIYWTAETHRRVPKEKIKDDRRNCHLADGIRLGRGIGRVDIRSWSSGRREDEGETRS